MGLDVAEISELAALRPIHTAVSGARATEVPVADDDATAADTGCVTPKASGARSATAEGADDADAGCVTPRETGSMAMLPIAPLEQGDGTDVGFATPLVTGGVIGPRDGLTAGDEGSFTTPTTADSSLQPATVCPPAPRKSAPVPTRKRPPLQQRLFYPVPSDLTTVFLAVPQCPAPPAKKMRAHAVEPSAPLGT